MLFSLLLQQQEGGDGAFATLLSFILSILLIIGLWKVYTKADEPGWAAIIPIYNLWVLLRIVGRPGWWLLLFLIPLVNVIVYIVVTIDLARSFSKSVLYGIGLLLLPMIFTLHLGFGDARYRGPAAAT